MMIYDRNSRRARQGLHKFHKTGVFLNFEANLLGFSQFTKTRRRKIEASHLFNIFIK